MDSRRGAAGAASRAEVDARRTKAERRQRELDEARRQAELKRQEAGRPARTAVVRWLRRKPSRRVAPSAQRRSEPPMHRTPHLSPTYDMPIAIDPVPRRPLHREFGLTECGDANRIGWSNEARVRPGGQGAHSRDPARSGVAGASIFVARQSVGSVLPWCGDGSSPLTTPCRQCRRRGSGSSDPDAITGVGRYQRLVSANCGHMPAGGDRHLDAAQPTLRSPPMNDGSRRTPAVHICNPSFS